MLAILLALVAVGCARHERRAVADVRKPKAATLLPEDLAIGFLQEIKSQPGRSLLAGETAIPPCQFTEKGAWSAGEYRKLIGQRAPSQVTEYYRWILFKIEDVDGRDLAPAEIERRNAWNYSLRTPRTARTVFGTTDRCMIGPTTEPVRKVVEALAALGVEVAREYAYIAPKN